jgi:hypothetical protein
MAHHCKWQIIWMNSIAIINDFNQVAPPCATRIINSVAPASIEFSRSSLTTDEGAQSPHLQQSGWLKQD